MNTSGIILICLGIAVVLLGIIFLIARWYVERKRQKALARKSLIERSFASPSVCDLFCYTHGSLLGQVRGASIVCTGFPVAQLVRVCSFSMKKASNFLILTR